VLRRVKISDAAAASGMFELLMGTDVGPRRDFIVGGATELDLAKIDV
jgi:DNA gyrase subunit B